MPTLALERSSILPSVSSGNHLENVFLLHLRTQSLNCWKAPESDPIYIVFESTHLNKLFYSRILSTQYLSAKWI